jgi:hypothetical protein
LKIIHYKKKETDVSPWFKPICTENLHIPTEHRALQTLPLPEKHKAIQVKKNRKIEMNSQNKERKKNANVN